MNLNKQGWLFMWRISFKLKGHGVVGDPLEFVQVHVTSLPLIIEQDTTMEVKCHVRAMLQKWPLVAKVRQYQ